MCPITSKVVDEINLKIRDFSTLKADL